jgi:hypothetical protein
MIDENTSPHVHMPCETPPVHAPHVSCLRLAQTQASRLGLQLTRRSSRYSTVSFSLVLVAGT